jgi:hypothetical protein
MPVLAGADIRGFYAALAIHLAPQSERNASVRCFANPDAHRREDRDPSLSVRLIDGVWNCHACGARGGPYDAAIAQGHSTRSAMDLLVAYGLAERRPGGHGAGYQRAGATRAAAARPVQCAQRPTGVASPARLGVDERDLAGWQAALASRPRLVNRLVSERAWGYDAMRELELGFDRGRITIPIRSRHWQLRGVLRYRPNGRPKMLAVNGTRLGLIPHPAVESSEHVLLVEGPPDMIAARSHGLPAIAVPGDRSWRPEWAPLLAGRRVTVVTDADAPGRELASRIAGDLHSVVSELVAVDLAPEREDGYDLTDWLLEHPVALTLAQLPRLV